MVEADINIFESRILLLPASRLTHYLLWLPPVAFFIATGGISLMLIPLDLDTR